MTNKTRVYRLCEWIDYLVAHPEKQTQKVLKRQDGTMCCLGALCELNPDLVELKLDLDKEAYYHTRGCLGPTPNYSNLPDSVESFFRFTSSYAPTIQLLKGFDSLAEANDSGVSWQEIANFICQYPGAVFDDNELVRRFKSIVNDRRLHHSPETPLVEVYQNLHPTL